MKGKNHYIDIVYEKLKKDNPNITKKMVRLTINFFIRNLWILMKKKKYIYITKYFRLQPHDIEHIYYNKMAMEVKDDINKEKKL